MARQLIVLIGRGASHDCVRDPGSRPRTDGKTIARAGAGRTCDTGELALLDELEKASPHRAPLQTDSIGDFPNICLTELVNNFNDPG